LKKPRVSVLAAVTLAFLAFTLGFFLGGSRDKHPVQVSVPAAMQTRPSETAARESVPQETEPPVRFPIDLNTATLEQLQALPGIGPVLAKRIVSYREENGPFSAAGDLMLVEGIGEKRMEEILDLISIGG